MSRSQRSREPSRSPSSGRPYGEGEPGPSGGGANMYNAGGQAPPYGEGTGGMGQGGGGPVQGPATGGMARERLPWVGNYIASTPVPAALSHGSGASTGRAGMMGGGPSSEMMGQQMGQGGPRDPFEMGMREAPPYGTTGGPSAPGMMGQQMGQGGSRDAFGMEMGEAPPYGTTGGPPPPGLMGQQMGQGGPRDAFGMEMGEAPSYGTMGGPSAPNTMGTMGRGGPPPGGMGPGAPGNAFGENVGTASAGPSSGFTMRPEENRPRKIAEPRQRGNRPEEERRAAHTRAKTEYSRRKRQAVAEGHPYERRRRKFSPDP